MRVSNNRHLLGFVLPVSEFPQNVRRFLFQTTTNQIMKNKLSNLFPSSIAFSSILLAPVLHAASITWDAGGEADLNWSTFTNWSDDAPATGDDVTFVERGTVALGVNNIVDASIQVASLTYNFDSATGRHITEVADGHTLTVDGKFTFASSTTATQKIDVRGYGLLSAWRLELRDYFLTRHLKTRKHNQQ